jgi:dTDP-4-amino-4,6-dideoxygalactose transaminase
MIPFNKACATGKEVGYITEAISSGQITGDGKFTKLCHEWFAKNMGFKNNLLTTSCSMAMDMSALLLDIKPGDEVILPSFTFVSTANSFVLRGAKVKFVDIRPDTMNIDEKLIEQAITPKTKVIVPVHYAGVACEMDTINSLAKNYNIAVVEDAAQGMKSTYKGQNLGGIGDMGAYSFHGTKNYTSAGEGGLLIIKSEEHFKLAEVIREKGTNRSQFFRGSVDKYTWVSVGSSFLPSDICAAYLLAQLEEADQINQRRLQIWAMYNKSLKDLAKNNKATLPTVPEHCMHNAHMFYLKLNSEKEASAFAAHMKQNDIITPFHYVPLHSSPAGQKFGEFVGEDKFTSSESAKLIRLPLFYNMTNQEVIKVIEVAFKFFEK